MSALLYFDIGNTRIKLWGCNRKEQLFHEARVHQNNIQDCALELLRSLDIVPQQILGACVLGEGTEANFTAACQKQWGISPVYARSSAYQAGVKNAYKTNPELLGVDRWLGLIAAREFAQPACIVSCGSAITLDTMDKDGNHAGGYILPGFTMMRDALLAGTGKVRFQALSWDSPELGRNTADAVAHGALAAILALTKQEQAKITPQGGLLILTGGDASLLLPHLEGNLLHIPDLLLKGMQRYFADTGINADL